MLRTLWSLLLPRLVSLHSLSPPEPLQSVWLASQTPALFRARNNYWIARRREAAAAGAALKPSNGVKKSSAVVGQSKGRSRSKDSKSLPSTYWQTRACSLKPSQIKSVFFQILTEKWWSFIVPFSSNGFSRSWCISSIFLLENRRVLRGLRSCAGEYLRGVLHTPWGTDRALLTHVVHLHLASHAAQRLHLSFVLNLDNEPDSPLHSFIFTSG